MSNCEHEWQAAQCNKCWALKGRDGAVTEPVEPYQGEPVAWLYKGTTIGEVLRSSRLDNYYPHKYGEHGEYVKGVPLYAHADPDEVNSYTVAEHERLVARGQEINIACINSLRAQLAERDALLREIKDEGATWPLRKPLVSRLEVALANGAALSASAEPSAPDIDPRECRKCGSLTADKCKAVGCWFDRESSAPVERDERAEFEAHMLRDFPGVHLIRALDRESYRNPSHQGAWLSWQARAALERKP